MRIAAPLWALSGAVCIVGVLSILSCRNTPPKSNEPYGKGLPYVSSAPTPNVREDTLRLDSVWAIPLRPIRKFALSANALRSPTAIRMIGRRLIVLQPTATHGLFVIDPQVGRIIATGLPTTDAPRQYFGSIVEDPNDHKAVWVHDVYSQRLLHLRLASLADVGAELEPDSTVALAFRGALRTPWPVRSGFIASGFLDRGVLVKFAADGRPQRLLGGSAFDSLGLVDDVRHHLTVARIVAQPSTQRIAMAYLSSPFLELRNSAAALQARWYVTLGTNAFTVPRPVRDGSGRLRFGADSTTRSMFLDIASSQRFVYALYSGHRLITRPRDSTAAAFRDASGALGMFVVAMTWSGVVERVISIPEGASRIAVSHDDQYLYTAGLIRDSISEYRLAMLTNVH